LATAVLDNAARALDDLVEPGVLGAADFARELFTGLAVSALLAAAAVRDNAARAFDALVEPGVIGADRAFADLAGLASELALVVGVRENAALALEDFVEPGVNGADLPECACEFALAL
jgi:enhancing lycopene biosynthesis protein 2